MERTITAPVQTKNDCYSLNGEDYQAGGIDDALAEMSGDEYGVHVGRQYWLAAMASPKPSKFFVLDDVIDGMNERACENYGEYAEDFLKDLSKEKLSELQSLVADWIDANAKVTFFMVADPVVRTVTQEDADYDRQFHEKVEAAMSDPRPAIPHDQAMAMIDSKINQIEAANGK